MFLRIFQQLKPLLIKLFFFWSLCLYLKSCNCLRKVAKIISLRGDLLTSILNKIAIIKILLSIRSYRKNNRRLGHIELFLIVITY